MGNYVRKLNLNNVIIKIWGENDKSKRIIYCHTNT